MGNSAVTTRSLRIAGRVEEQRLLGDSIQQAAEGKPCALFVHGEAGVGKTHLVGAVCEQALESGFTVLWGRCVHFGAVEAPFLPLLNALDGWARSVDAAERSEVLSTVDGAAELLPWLGAGGTAAPVRLLTVVDALVTAIAAHRPTVLVVDDLQWADAASRDALAYLVTGFTTQRLVIVATQRDEQLATGHPLHGWLADLRRLPSVVEVPLERMSPAETEQQIAMAIGGVPHQRLVSEVVSRSLGNAYLSELLVRGLTVDDERLPAGLPVALKQALLAAWHRLSPFSREVVRTLAVAGRPSTLEDLSAVAVSTGQGADALGAALTAAAEHGLVVAHGASYWFRHPLLAETLYDTLLPGEAAPVHRAWAARLESSPPRAGMEEVHRQADLALHFEGANEMAASFEASMRAADGTQDARQWRETAVHLARAAGLWSSVHEGSDADPDGEADLLERLALTSSRVGDAEQALAAWARVVELADPGTSPLRVGRVLVESADVAWEAAHLERDPSSEYTRAVELTRAFPDSPEHAEALAALSEDESWRAAFEPSRKHAELAVTAARRSGSPRALSVAYRARAFAYMRDLQQADRDSREALRYARLCEEPELFGWASVARSNHLLQQGRTAELIDCAREGFHTALAAGATSMAAFQAALLARHLLVAGRLGESGEVLREGLSVTGVANGAAAVRLSATLLAVRRGDLRVAGLHSRRARELVPVVAERPGLEAPPILAEHLLARGRPEEALDLLSRTMTVQSVDPRVVDDMLMWGARAAADLAERARDRGILAGSERAAAALDALITQRRHLPEDPFAVQVSEDPVQPALNALFDSERGRCAGQRRMSGLWEEAAGRCESAGMHWEQQIATWRWAQAALSEGTRRTAVASPLRSVHRFAVTEGAEPLRQEVEALATAGQIRLDEPARPVPGQSSGTLLATLTRREAEVLSHLVAGRTYAEIAAALVISEKTVSAHVSNLLGKTGTTSRTEVSVLARRLGRPTADGHS
ncbi:MAG TPA: AAA family ATPase [Nocardioidaceae bacterium]|nr:AAA family ATPase [Nocardioidaceae bacterium]